MKVIYEDPILMLPLPPFSFERDHGLLLQRIGSDMPLSAREIFYAITRYIVPNSPGNPHLHKLLVGCVFGEVHLP